MDENQKITVLFVCTGNSCRSQMAEAMVRVWAGDRVDVMSAGSHPAREIAPTTTIVMNEIGIDVSNQVTKGFDAVQDKKWDYVITLCDHARDFCPVFRSKAGISKTLHWSIPDPITASNDPVKSLEAYRSARDDIAARIKEWLKEELGIRVE